MLKPKEIAEISLLLWYLPLEKVEELKKLVLELKQQHGYKEPVDDSDEWTEEDLRDAMVTSMRHADATVPYEWDESNMGGDGPSKGDPKEPAPYRRIRRDVTGEEDPAREDERDA